MRFGLYRAKDAENNGDNLFTSVFYGLPSCTVLQLFDQSQRDDNHLLFNLLTPPSTSSQNYNLRTRPHSQQLPKRTGHLTDSNFFQECFSETLTHLLAFTTLIFFGKSYDRPSVWPWRWSIV